MAHEQLYKDDLATRFPTFTFVETAVGGMTKFEAKDGDTVMAEHTKPALSDAVALVREELVGGADVLPTITLTQRNALTGITDGCPIWNKTDAKVEVFIGGAWLPA